MTTQIGKLDEEQLERNVRKLVASIRGGLLSQKVVLESRILEIERLNLVEHTKNNKVRIDYICREIRCLLEVLYA